MRLKKGDVAREFSVFDGFGRQINLNDYSGGKLLLSFYRYASCPLCNLRVHDLIEKHSSFKERGLEMIGFFQSPKESLLTYLGKQKPPFPIIPDPDRKVYQLYGVESSWFGFIKGLKIRDFLKAKKKGFSPGKMEGKKNLIPADFLIDKNQIIQRAYYGKDIGDHLPIEEIKRFLDI